MRRGSPFHDQRAEPQVLAVFGGAELMKHLEGKVELRGGSAEDQRAASEWANQFIPGVFAALLSSWERRKK